MKRVCPASLSAEVVITVVPGTMVDPEELGHHEISSIPYETFAGTIE
jgi:hypothetical protein